jgi:competence ComEA-like helix-hairpin-helix protein
MRKHSDPRRRAGRPAISRFAVCLLLFGAAWAQSAGSLPEGQGKAEFARVCGQCHGLQIITKKTNTADAWAGVVDDMVSRGAQGTEEELDRVVTYLGAHFGPRVSVNTAGAKELSAALEVSAADADAIVHYRETVGHYKEWRDLQKVPGIDIKKLEQKKDRIDFSTDQDATGNRK